MVENPHGVNDNSDKDLEVFLKKYSDRFLAFAGFGGLALISEPFFKSIDDSQVEKINDFLIRNGINFDSKFLHDQFTDYIYMAGAFTGVNALAETMLVEPLPDEGKWGINKENWRIGTKLMSASILMVMAICKEGGDAIVSNGINFFDKIFSDPNFLSYISNNMDNNDMRAYVIGLLAGVVAWQIGESRVQKSVEIDE